MTDCKLWTRLASACLALSLASCAEASLIEARVQAARDTDDALSTFQDYEIGETAAAARLSELEGLYQSSQADPRVVVLLARAWSRVSFEFIQDAYEEALEVGDKPRAAYHLARARAGYERAMYFADAWLTRKDGRFIELTRAPADLAPYLARSFGADSAEALLFAGVARVGYASTHPDPALAATARRAGRVLLERAEALAPGLFPGLASLFIALSAIQDEPRDLLSAERAFERGDKSAAGTRLLIPVMRARTLACVRRDRQLFEIELDRVLRESDNNARLRLENAAAKRRARRYLTSSAIDTECFAPALKATN